MTVVDTVYAGSGAWGAGLDPVNGEVFVADLNGGTVCVINTTTDNLTSTITVGYRPTRCTTRAWGRCS